MVFCWESKSCSLSFFSLGFEVLTEWKQNSSHLGPQSSVKESKENILKGGLNETYFRHCDMQFWCGVAREDREFVRSVLDMLFEELH